MQTVSTKCRQRKMRALKHLNRTRPAWVAALSASASAMSEVAKFPGLSGAAATLYLQREGLIDHADRAELLQSRGDVSGTIEACGDALSASSLVSDLAFNLARQARDMARAAAEAEAEAAARAALVA